MLDPAKPIQTRKVWVNVYDTLVRVYNTKSDCKKGFERIKKRIACVEVEIRFVKGQGL